MSKEREIDYFMMECNLRQEYKECIADMLEKVKQEAFMEQSICNFNFKREYGKGKIKKAEIIRLSGSIKFTQYFSIVIIDYKKENYIRNRKSIMEEYQKAGRKDEKAT